MSVLGAIGIGTGGSTKSAASWCVPKSLPAATTAAAGELLDLRASVAAAEPERGRRYAIGIALAQDMWSDDGPQGLNATRMEDGRWPAGWELRWWTRDYNAVADVVMFPSSRQAGKFFGEAASTSCHRSGASHATDFAPQARDLTWVNPDNARQSDTFLLRGPRVYRVGAVRLAHTQPVGQRAELEFVEALACRLPSAECRVARKAQRRTPAL